MNLFLGKIIDRPVLKKLRKQSMNLFIAKRPQNLSAFTSHTNRCSERKYVDGNLLKQQEKIRELTYKLNKLQIMNLNQVMLPEENKMLSAKISEDIRSKIDTNSLEKSNKAKISQGDSKDLMYPVSGMKVFISK